MISSPPFPVTIMSCPNGDVMLLPALWPVRLTPVERRKFAQDLLALDEEPANG